MQYFLVIIVGVFSIASTQLQAHDDKSPHSHPVTYVAGLTGAECAGCKKTIAKKIGRLKGVKTIRIEKISDNSHRLYVITDGSQSLTKAAAVKALGKDVEHYTITSWKKS